MLLRKILSIFEHKLSTQKQVKMYYLNIPDIETQRVSFYLAVEEYAARFLKEDPWERLRKLRSNIFFLASGAERNNRTQPGFM